MGFLHIEKKCGGCGQVKPVSDFYRSAQKRDGYCKKCRRIRDRNRAKKKRVLRYDQNQRRDYKLRKLYGITLLEYNEMTKLQNGCCAICGSNEIRRIYGERPRLVVDHNHYTDKVRGLLCCSCNGRLSAIEDEQFMLLAKRYLEHRDGYQFV